MKDTLYETKKARKKGKKVTKKVSKKVSKKESKKDMQGIRLESKKECMQEGKLKRKERKQTSK